MAIYKKDDVLAAMPDKWEQALIELCGWDRAIFKGRHQPCPICGGSDRFRWGHKDRNKRQDGFAYCSGSCGGAHDGMYWFMTSRNQPFNEAINDLGDWIGGLTPEKRETIVKEAKKFAAMQQRPHEDYSLTPDEVELIMSKGTMRDGFLYVPCFRALGGTPCNVAKIAPDRSVTFAAGGRTWGAYGLIHPVAEGRTAYLVADPVHAAKVSARTGAEVWITFTPGNAVEVALEYEGDREIRMVATDPDEIKMYNYERTGRPCWGADFCGAFE